MQRRGERAFYAPQTGLTLSGQESDPSQASRRVAWEGIQMSTGPVLWLAFSAGILLDIPELVAASFGGSLILSGAAFVWWALRGR